MTVILHDELSADAVDKPRARSDVLTFERRFFNKLAPGAYIGTTRLSNGQHVTMVINTRRTRKTQ